MFTNRAGKPLRKLMVILAGGIELFDLAVTKVSPLNNICKAIYLSDAKRAEAVKLVVKGLEGSKVSGRQAEILGEEIYNQVEGHLYLTQRIGGLLQRAIYERVEEGDPYLTPEMVNLVGQCLTPNRSLISTVVKDLAEKLMDSDPLFISLHKSLSEFQLLRTGKELLTKQLKFSRLDEGMTKLELLGVAKEQKGYWVIRNPLLGWTLQNWLEPSKPIDEGGQMNYEHGLEILKQLAEGIDWFEEFDLYEAQLRENLRDERHYGPSEQSRRDRARIIENLNALTRDHLDISFNELCITDPDSDPDTLAIKEELEIHQQNLRLLRKQAAVYGVGAVPLHLLNQIEYEKEKIRELKRRLGE
jgi:hypothetical protein